LLLNEQRKYEIFKEINKRENKVKKKMAKVIENI